MERGTRKAERKSVRALHSAFRVEKRPAVAHTRRMNRSFTAVIKQDDGWWIGWIEEVAGVNSQGRSKAELLANLRSALKEALAMNREDAIR